MKNRMRRATALLAISALGVAGLAGCNRDSDDASDASSGKVVKIGVVVPLSGDVSSFGQGIKNSVDLAIKQANQAGKLKGWNIVLDAQDDTGKPDPGANAANKLASDPTVGGVIGTYNSSVAQQVAPILQKARIPQISPANTNPGLTMGPADKPGRVWDTYFRVCTTDNAQGPFGAQYAYKTAALKSVVTVNDTKAYGAGLTKTFEAEFKKQGGTVLSQETVAPNDKDFGGLVTKITQLKPDFVFFGGEVGQGAPLSAQLGQGGFKGPLMGGDGIQSADFTSGGGRPGDLATSVGAPVEKLATAKAYLDAYKAAGYKEDHEAYGALAYDAANILIDALVKALASAGDVQSARPEIIKAVQATSGYAGAAGTTTFDQYGDTSNKTLTANKVEGGAWKDVYTGNVEGA
jgi:branched-chain amino acid transport system substrate-binding protein